MFVFVNVISLELFEISSHKFSWEQDMVKTSQAQRSSKMAA